MSQSSIPTVFKDACTAKLFSRCTTNIHNCSRLLLCFSLSAFLRILVHQIPFRFQFQYVGVHWYYICIFPIQLHVCDLSCLVSIWITREIPSGTQVLTSIIFHWMAMFSKEFSFSFDFLLKPFLSLGGWDRSSQLCAVIWVWSNNQWPLQ